MMKFSKYIVLTILVFASVTCKKEKSIIPEKEMVTILTKIYLTDGIISVPSKSSLYRIDTIGYYEPILEKYGYTAEQFDSSIIFYSKKTEVLDRIYDNVIMQLTIQKDKLLQAKDTLNHETETLVNSSANLWPLKTSWNMAIDYPNNPSLGFDIPTPSLGIYTISFDAQIFPDDEAIDARHYIFFYYNNNTPTGVRENPKTFVYKKDGKKHHFTYQFVLKNKQVTHLKGWLYDTGNGNSSFKRSAKFENIMVTYTPTKEKIKETPLPLKKGKLKPLKKIKKIDER
ncbi:DUF4296 domain-containing protein [Tenuifilum sp.]|uniref:DUF4296 domain-containing protein n=1 Tax=Tenuifilum sp. TaxID=2760880 RepID=UPI00259088FB|nr:DUF4296 domain-containing protein [Tenuifilum sp.]